MFWLVQAIACFQGVGSAELANLIVSGTPKHPALLLELGNAPPSFGTPASGVRVIPGELSAQEAGLASQLGADEVVLLHPGFGHWSVAFRFILRDPPAKDPYTFWARWRQGGEPNVCVQTFEFWAGRDTAHLERRGEFRLKPKGWEYAWLAAETPVHLQPDDRLIEVRNHGAGHDAKVFDAFLLGPPAPPTTLPVKPTPQQQAVLLELGQRPAWMADNASRDLRVIAGALITSTGAGGKILEKDEVQVLHGGFGTFGARFRFDLNSAIPPGQYRFFARYKSGGEVSQVAQTFTLWVGSDPANLVRRGEFVLVNDTPWEYQWLGGKGTLAILPGDRFVEVENAGKADGAKVYDAFLLQMDQPLADWMAPEDAVLRNRFLSQIRTVEHPVRYLYVLDGPGADGSALFKGLANPVTRRHYDRLAVRYLIGLDAEAMARVLNLPVPSALISDDHFTLLGFFAGSGSPAQVARFLTDPQRYGKLPTVPSSVGEEARPLRGGVPEAWLVGGVMDGPAGLALFGLDSETVQRPNPDEPYLGSEMMGGRIQTWKRVGTDADGVVAIDAVAGHDYRWSKGTGYAQLYLRAEQATRARLSLSHTGVSAAAWLDGRPLAVSGAGAELDLSEGWHGLLLKFIRQHDRGHPLSFKARFTNEQGTPLTALNTHIADPQVDIALNRIAAKLRPLVYVDAPANLPRPGSPLRLRIDLRWHSLMDEQSLPAPLPRFRAKLRVLIKDYRGRVMGSRETEGLFPDIATFDFGKAPRTGYYAVYPSLYTPEGKVIMAYAPDGFSVVAGNASQKARLSQKKVWNNDYYAFADGDRSFGQVEGYFTWLERMGIFRSYGSYPGFEAKHKTLWEEARKRGVELFADTAGDSHWLHDDPETGRSYIKTVAPYTRYFKSSNEIDIRREGEWRKLRDPAHWVQRARWEYEAVHKARPDGHYVGGSLVRPGDFGDNAGYPHGLGPGRWFEEVLKLGLDRYLDAWDVHAYPQHPPRFGGPIGNADSEDERGVLAAYARLGRANELSFWLGEAGAKAAHGFTGRRWQAEQVAKMVAWANSRPDYLGIAFCIAHEYDLGVGRLWDYAMGHKPGEAALYTASALIDGLPYKAVETSDPKVQAAYFGKTWMAWRADEKAGEWQIKLDPREKWLIVDVVGQTEDLPVPADAQARIPLTASPVYVVSEAEYRHLTGE